MSRTIDGSGDWWLERDDRHTSNGRSEFRNGFQAAERPITRTMANPILDYERPKPSRRKGWFLYVVATFVAVAGFVATFGLASLMLGPIPSQNHGFASVLIVAAVAVFSYCVAAIAFRAIVGTDA